MSKSSFSTASSVVSGTNTTPRLARTGWLSRPALTTVIPARRRMSMTVTASISSQPCASGTRTVFMGSLFHGSVAEVLILQREVGDGFLDECDRILQVIAILAGYAHGIALYAGL